MKEKIVILALIILFSIPSVYGLLRSGFIATDDADWMLIRFTAFHQTLADGQFPVRFLGRINHEYGYPVANFNYPAFMYLSEIPKIAGFGFVDSIKILLSLSMVFSSVFAYLWLKKLFGTYPSLVGSLMYLYAPYHLFDLYKRGSVGEVLGLSIVPFILWQIERRSLLFTSLSIALLILSHNILALLFLPIIFLYTFLKFKTLPFTLYPFLLGLGLSSFFWIPAIYDLQYTVFSQTTVSDWQAQFANLDMIGISTIFIFILAAVMLYIQKKKIKERKPLIIMFVIGFGSLLFSISITKTFWEILPVSLIQYPFRLLSIVILSAAFLAAFVVSQSPKKIRFWVGLAFIFLTVFSSWPIMNSIQYVDKGDAFYSTNMHSTTIKNEYMPKWVKMAPSERPRRVVEVVEGAGKVESIMVDNREVRFTVLMESEGAVRVNRIYFPGWRVFVNEREEVISYDNEGGVMEIFIPRGEQQVKAAFSETPVRLFADSLSLGALGLLGLLAFRRYGKRA